MGTAYGLGEEYEKKVGNARAPSRARARLPVDRTDAMIPEVLRVRAVPKLSTTKIYIKSSTLRDGCKYQAFQGKMHGKMDRTKFSIIVPLNLVFTIHCVAY
eukprot:SAG31_NODE_290_length_18324_cov_33.408889_1_plen_101_part_00